MAEKSNFEIANLYFWQGRPASLPVSFSDLQELRATHYTREFGRAGRNEAEIAHYVGRLIEENFADPQKAVGSTARTGQLRLSALATAAFDGHSHKLRGLIHGARNVSSWFEPKLAKLGIPPAVNSRVGNFERTWKLNWQQEYVWGSECVYDEEQPGLTEALFALQLEAYDYTLAGTFYPWTEEKRLKQDLTRFGYHPDKHKPLTLSGDKAFGAHTAPTEEERWVVPRIEIVSSRIGRIAGAAAALSQARESLVVETQ